MRKRTESTVAIYNGQIADLRASHTLQEIGDICGVSRERARQILNKFYPDSLYPSAFSTSQLALALGISAYCVKHLCERLCISPMRQRGRRKRNFWNPDIVPKLKEALEHGIGKCRMCGNPIFYPKHVFCSSQCWREGTKYKNRSPEQRKRHGKACQRWAANHKEKVAEINKKSMDKYMKKKLATHQYTIVGKCEVPIGTIVKNVGRRNSRADINIPVKWKGRVYHISIRLLRLVKS